MTDVQQAVPVAQEVNIAAEMALFEATYPHGDHTKYRDGAVIAGRSRYAEPEVDKMFSSWLSGRAYRPKFDATQTREAEARGMAFAKLNNWLDDHGYAGSLADLRAVRGDCSQAEDRQRREAYSRLWNILGDNARNRSDLNLLRGGDL